MDLPTDLNSVIQITVGIKKNTIHLNLPTFL